MKLGIIGCGKMGRALVGGILEAGICSPKNVTVFDSYGEAADSMVSDLGVEKAGSNSEVIDSSEIILLCVKPQGFVEMLGELGESTGRLLVSIAAGIQIDAIERGCGGRHRVIRVMPNTPALIGRGASAFALGSTATEDDAHLTESLLKAVGYVCRVEEKDLDAVTALSGSGPAYVFLMIESLVAAGITQGLSPEIAHDLALQTVAGAAELAVQSDESPSTLRENVTSPNGTTFAALESFRSDNFPKIVENAVTAAAERSRELALP